MINVIKKISIIQREDPDNSNNDTIVELINVSDGVDGSGAFNLTNEPDYLSIENNNSYPYRSTLTLDIRVLKPSGNAYSGKSNEQKLIDWSNEQQDLYISALTLDGVINIGDFQSQSGLCKISINEQLSDSDVLAIKVTKTLPIGFSQENGIYQGGVYLGKNMLSVHEWGDKSSSGIADGWVQDGDFTSTSFSSGIQSLTCGDAQIAEFQKTIFFPFPLTPVTFSINIDSIGSSYDTNRLRVNNIGIDGVTISADVLNITSTGRRSYTLTTDEGVSRLQFTYQLRATSGTEVTEISDPCATINGLTTYTKF